ncbi:hypothetical protein ACFV6E_39925 [Streptomyces sp. NPDC059785]|uniref:hypothetical protein n=1 Tax=unclassified Streptomyces TaxID=2593676 RepID=UPI00366A4049
MFADLSPLIAATAQWLTRAYPAGGGALDAALTEVQARQAVTVAAWLRYPTATDAALVALAGPGGSARLDRLSGARGPADRADLPDPSDDPLDEAGPSPQAWRTWVDEVVASWAACLLGDPELAGRAVSAVADCGHATGLPAEFQRLVSPDARDRRAAALLRHPDLLAPVADLHRAALTERLGPGQAQSA